MIPSDPLIGQQLANYRIEQLLARGGMAKVYLGWDVTLHRSVAVKVIDDRFRDESEYTERFLREARTMATWQHPNIPQVYHAGEEQGVLFFAMEYIRGQNLAQLLGQRQADGELLPHGEALRIGRAVAEALDYAHQKGVIHRDVTPSNVILSEDGRIVLTDFGLALDVIRGTQGVVFGTPHYMAPEQARSSAEAVPQTDLYSLGVILYEILTGAAPFDDPSPTALALKHITDQPPPPTQVNPEIGPDVEAVLLKALRKAPLERYQSGQELMEALKSALYRESSENVPATLTGLHPGSDPYPPPTLAEIPGSKEPGPQPEISKPEVATPEREAGGPTRVRPITLILGGLGCGLLILIGLVLLVRGTSLALTQQSSPTRTQEIDSFSQATRTSTQRPTATPARTVRPSQTATLTPTVTLAPTLEPYELSIVGYKDDSLFIVNQARYRFPLSELEIKNRRGGVSGEEWELDYLEDGECVAIWKEEGQPQAPEHLECDEVGERLVRSGPDKFWTERIEVYYQGEKIETCETRREACSIQISRDEQGD